jgi:hypothetical protein
MRSKPERKIEMIGVESFENLWMKYPRQIGKKRAFTHFKASVKTMQDILDIQKALWNYVQKIKKERTEEKYIQYGSTWFNNWRDWLDYGCPKPKEDIAPCPPLRASEKELSEEDRAEAVQLFQTVRQQLRTKALS